MFVQYYFLDKLTFALHGSDRKSKNLSRGFFLTYMETTSKTLRTSGIYTQVNVIPLDTNLLYYDGIDKATSITYIKKY